MQLVLQSVFGLWLGYRAMGLEHVPRTGGALILANHQSYLDPLLIGLPLQRPVSYIARHNLFRVPIVGWILRNTYVMPIHREAAGSGSIREMIRRLEHGFLVGIFPEGTRSRDGTLGPLKPGFISVLRRSNVPVIPVGVAGAMRAMPRGVALLRPAQVTVAYGRPIPREAFDGLSKEQLIELIRERIAECITRAEEW